MSVTTTRTLTIRPVGGAIGAEVTGVRPSELDDVQFATVNAALADHLVLFFPQWHPTLDEHRRFAARFGELEVHPVLPKVDDEVPEVVLIDGGVRADTWHTDVTWVEHPPVASVFHYVEGPAHGGDTMWTNMEAAFASLSIPVQEFVSGLTATHAGALFGLPDRTAVHPVVRVHPVTGRPALYVNRTWTSHINEVSAAESDALLTMLYTHTEQAQFTVRRSWTPGDACIWDNRSTMHLAVNDYGTNRRVAHRVTVLGDDPQPAGTLRHESFVEPGFSARTGLDLVHRMAKQSS